MTAGCQCTDNDSDSDSGCAGSSLLIARSLQLLFIRFERGTLVFLSSCSAGGCVP